MGGSRRQTECHVIISTLPVSVVPPPTPSERNEMPAQKDSVLPYGLAARGVATPSWYYRNNGFGFWVWVKFDVNRIGCGLPKLLVSICYDMSAQTEMKEEDVCVCLCIYALICVFRLVSVAF